MKTIKIFRQVALLLACLFLITQNIYAVETIDTDLDVGAIDGAHAVNLTGAFTYTIPIKIPEGTMGMQPNLSLNYNSQGGNGIAGYGWNLSGMSAISRMSRNIYNDGSVKPVELTGSDKYALDGTRLIKSGNNPTEQQFCTEIENFSQIKCFYPANNTTTATNPVWFRVKTKDGKTIEYGNTNDSKLNTEDGEIALIWYINKVTDRNGNYMTYHYTKTGRQVLLSSIKYTGNDTPHPNNPAKPLLTPFTEIDFIYKDRADKSNAIIGNSKVENHKLLDRIRIETGGTHYKSYDLNHTNKYFGYLTEFEEWGSEIKSFGKERLNSLTFEYDGIENYSFENYKVTSTVSNGNYFTGGSDVNHAIIPGNFNGDGLQDFLLLKYLKVGNDEGKYYGISLQINNSTPELEKFTEVDLTNKIVNQAGNFSFIRYLNPGDRLRPWNENTTQPIADLKVFAGDFNGDNIDDIIIYDGDITTYRFFESTGVGQFRFNSADELKVSENNTATLIDVDGDNLLELFVMESLDDKLQFHLKSFDNRYNKSCTGFEGTSIDPSKVLGTPKDVDGDGKMEFEFIVNRNASSASSRYLFTFSPYLRTNTNLNLCDLITTDVVSRDYEDNTFFRPSHKKNFAPDFNGDGKADVFRLNSKNKEVEIIINDEFIDNNIPYFAYPENKFYVADLNSDGLTDVFYAKDGFSTDQLVFYINRNEGKIFTKFTYSTTGVVSADKDFVQMADIDGDGAVEILFKRLYEDLKVVKLNFGKPTDRLLTSVRDSYANETKVQYNRLSSKQSYTVNENLTYPLRVIDGPFYVTDKVEIPTNVDNYFGEKTYAYENLIAHLEGKGLLGFKKVTETDNLNGIIAESNFELDKQTKALLLPSNSSKKLIASTNYCKGAEYPDCKISESTSSYTVNVSALGVKWLRLDQTDAIDHINKSKTVTQFQNYNIKDGNPRKTTSTIYDIKSNPAAVKYITTTDVTYENCEWWIDYLPKTVNTKLERKGYAGSNQRKVTYKYNLKDGNLEAETTDPTKTNELLTSYDHDDFGNPISSKIVATKESNTPERSTKVVYDNTGRFIINKYNNDSSTKPVTKTTFNKTWGLPATVTDINGNKTSFTYDNYGRLKTSTDYLNHTETIVMNWDIDPDAEDTDYDIASIFKVTSTKPGTAPTYAYFDNFNREVLNKTDVFGGGSIFTIKKFDKRGRVKEESGPFKDNIETEDKIYSYYEYDLLSRVQTKVTQKLVRNGNNAIEVLNKINYNYPTRMVEITGNDIIPKTTTYDVTGKVITVHESSDTEYLHYSYNNFNELYQTKDQEGNVLTENKYDDFGRQTTLIDINAGTTTYVYNAFGELISQTDAKDNITTISYDNLGRINTKKLTDANKVEINYTYTYNKANNANGALFLNKETGPNGYSTSYKYDGYGRQISYTDNVDNTNFTTSQTYDTYGNIKSLTYPDNFTVDYEYDKKTGSFYKATANNTVLYEIKELNHLGQISAYTYNNGAIKMDHEYNELGMPETVKANNGSLFNWEYDFNKTNGNLNSRKDVKNNKSESFKYDNLHRLTHVNNTQVVKYGYNGNIDYKQDAGNYTYDQQPQGKINAVTGITNDNNAIPALTECITYTAFDRPESIVEGNKNYELFYGADHQRRKTVYTENGKTTTRYYSGNYELITKGSCSAAQSIYYLSFANSVDVIYYKSTEPPQGCRVENNVAPADEFYYTFTDYLGSILKVVDSAGKTKEEQSFDAWGRKRNPTNWQVYDNPEDALPKTLSWLNRGYTGHEHLYQFGIINMNNRLYDPIVGRMLAVDNFVADSESTQAFNRYSYAMNNPLKYTDPSGEFLTWSLGNGGFSIGFNLTPIGIPLGAGINIGWGGGFSTGFYGEVGYRVGGTGLGAGATISQSFDYNFKQDSWSNTTGAGAYASFGPATVGANLSYTYTNGEWNSNWGVTVGLGFGNDASGFGLYVGYGSGGWSYGVGGYYNSKAWDSNPEYSPDEWNDNGETQYSNNCYSYACNDPNDHPVGGKPQPGEDSGAIFSSLTIDNVSEAAARDGLKKPNFFNKIGFGKRGYYEVYLVIDAGGDYHWYRQDKGGAWSHKPGHGSARNIDASGNRILNPSRANHNYGYINYNDGGMYLWVKK